ncbi:MAG: response regulator [Gemmatimonadaceae bacterium]|nr:response regulator [Gemmatimonadaceae bacterium]
MIDVLATTNAADTAVQSARVLVVDDEPALRRMLARVLETERYEVHLAADGAEALALVAHTPFDIIVADVVMPTCDGPCLLAGLKALGSTVPVIVLTGYADTDDAALMALGATRVLGKPIGAAGLLRVLAETLNASA